MNAATPTSPKYCLTTFGCQMNKNDSERIARILSGLGFVSTDNEHEADLLLFNTCSVRQSAEERIYGKMEDVQRMKEKNPTLIVGITGCMAGRDKNGVMRKKVPAADLFFPTHEMTKLPKWISELRPDLVNSGDIESDYLKIKPLRDASASARFAEPGMEIGRTQAYVTIQTGCNKFCTYCVVPYARGLEQNRLAKDVLDEVRDLAAHGVIEVTLLGQTVNSFKAKDPESFSPANPYTDGFAALLWEINQIEGIQRIHWTAPHPNSMTDQVIDALALPKQVNYLHLPVQAGSNEVLRRMNRKYTREQFLTIIEKVQAKRPGIALGTDIIVGFPGETPEQFEETVTLYRACDFDISYTAQYSPRSGTLGIKLFPDDVTKEEKRRRWDVLQHVMEETALRKNKALIGSVASVLVERVEAGFASGLSSEQKLVRWKCQDASIIGKIVPVRIVLAQEWQLSGDMLS